LQQLQELKPETYEIIEYPSDEDWDCSTVVTNRSTLFNNPTRIPRARIRVSKKTGIPLDGIDGSSVKAQRRMLEPIGEVVELPPVDTTRPKGESTEQRRVRKAAVKEAQRILRQMKKQGEEVIKEETSLNRKIQGHRSNFDVRQGVRHIRL